MKVCSFKKFLEEEDSKAIIQTGINSKSIDNNITKEIINSRLVNVTSNQFITPYIALGSIARVLAYANIVIPQYTFLDREDGEVVFDATQFGDLAGVNMDGSPARTEPDHFIYFSYSMNDEGYYDCFAALVDSDELEDIMDMGDDVDEVHNAQKLGEEAEEVNEDFPIGTNVRITNPSATPKHQIVDKDEKNYHIKRNYDDRIIKLPKDRIHRVNKVNMNEQQAGIGKETVVKVKGSESGNRYEMRLHGDGEHASIVQTHYKGESLKNQWGGFGTYKTGKKAYVEKHFNKINENEEVEEFKAGDKVIIHSPDDLDWHKREGKLLSTSSNGHVVKLDSGQKLSVTKDQIKKK